MGPGGVRMGGRPTIDDVAKAAGVHPATVSRALNRRTEHQVGRDTVERVRKVAESLGYVPNPIARGLRTSSTMTIGVVIPDLTNPFFPPVIRGVESHLASCGYTALLANTDESEALERLAIGSLLARRVDGLIIGSGHRDDQALREIHEAGVHAVMLNRDAGDVAYPLVVGQDADGIAAAVDHLVRLGHRELLHIAGPPSLSTSEIRLRAFEAAASAAGVRGRIMAVDALTAEAGQRATEAMLDGAGARATGVVAGNDLIALGVLRALRARGLRCPDDLSVIGFNDMVFAEDLHPPLTTVRVPARQMGEEAARLLLGMIDAGAPSTLLVRLPVELIVRQSTAPPALV